MTAPIFADVTADDIIGGEREHCASCPVALAVRRAFAARGKPYDRVIVSTYIEITGRRWHRLFAMGKALTSWIRRFDRGKPVSPIRIKLHDDTAEIVS